jgi:transglutaminase-like putative cysteine protease
VQSDSVLIKDLARRATKGAKDDLARMRKAEQFVREYIFGKNLSVGYASALEVATTRQGDCTEHALLLAAIARASGIPARVATGLAYVPRFGNREHVFVPHAWTEAWVDGRWHGFDAALNGFDSGHIALAVGDGDPVRYFAGVALLGRLQIEGIVRDDR